MKKFLLFFSILFLFTPFFAKADLGDKLSGKILLSVEENGEAWYVYPENSKRYYMGRPSDAFALMRNLGVGISSKNFENLRAGNELSKKLAGKIVLEVEKNGEAWYIYPDNLKKYYLGRPADAFRIMRELGLGITKNNLSKITKDTHEELQNRKYDYYKKNVDNKSVKIIEIDLDNPNLEIITEVASPYQKDSEKIDYYGVKTLDDFVSENNGFAGINGSYFCPYSNCEASNYYYFPVFDSHKKEMINRHNLKYPTTGPIIAFDENNKFYFFSDTRDFVSVENFENRFNTKLEAAIGNSPALVSGYKNILDLSKIDRKQKKTKSIRNGIAYKNNKIFLISVSGATVPELANIMTELGMEYAINLDGGNSSALYFENNYKVGPGRDIPNAIIFGQ